MFTIVRYKILFFNLPAAGRRKGAKMLSRQEKLQVFFSLRSLHIYLKYCILQNYYA